MPAARVIVVNKKLDAEMSYLLASIVESSDDAIITEKLDGTISSWNRGAENLYGYSAAEVVGRNISMVFPPELQQALVDVLGSVARGDRVDHFETMGVRKDGKRIEVSITVSPIHDESGRIIAASSIAQDITGQRKGALQKLRKSEEKYGRLANNAPDILFSVGVGPSPRIEYMSPACTAILGFSPEEMLADQTLLTKLMPPEQLLRIERFEENPDLVTGPFILETTHKSGRRITLEVRPVVIRDEKGVVKSVEGIARDITDQKKDELLLAIQADILTVLTRSSDIKGSLEEIVEILKLATGFDAVGIRLQERDDYPFHAAKGYSDEFLMAESTLALQYPGEKGVCRDKDGNISLECTCGLVISGKTDPANPLFTPGGSAWTNDSLPILDVPLEQDPRLNPRNRCIHVGFRSIALVPLRAGDRIIGLIHLASRRADCFTDKTIKFFEGIGVSIGVALQRKHVEDLLRESEERLRTLAGNIPDVIFRIRTVPSIGFEYLGSSCETVWGYSLNDFASDTQLMLKLAHPEDLPTLERLLSTPDRLMEPIVFRTIHKNTGIVWIEARMTPVHDDSGKLIAIDGVARDVTGRVSAERQLRESEERFRSIVETTSEWICTIDLNGKTTYNNPAIEGVLGYTVGEMQGRITLDFMHEDDMKRAEEILSKVGARKEGWDDETLRWRHKDGSYRFLEGSSSPLLDAEGRLRGYLVVHRDVTKGKLAEIELRRSKEEAVAAVLTAQTYLDFIAHDLTNILSPVMMYSEMISTDPRSHPWVKETATKVVKQIERAASFVRNTRRLSESERGESKKVEIVDLLTVLETKEEEILERYPNKRFNFERSLPSEGHINAMGKSYIEAIIEEVLDNAAKHGKSDDVRVDIKVHPIEKLEGHGYWKVEIADYGPGIPDDMKKGLMVEVFEPSNRMTRGIASSLSFMSLIAEHIGGRLRIEDRVQGDHTKGTKVVLLFRKVG